MAADGFNFNGLHATGTRSSLYIDISGVDQDISRVSKSSNVIPNQDQLRKCKFKTKGVLVLIFRVVFFNCCSYYHFTIVIVVVLECEKNSNLDTDHEFIESKYKMVGVLPIRIVKSNVSSVGHLSDRNQVFL